MAKKKKFKLGAINRLKMNDFFSLLFASAQKIEKKWCDDDERSLDNSRGKCFLRNETTKKIDILN